jgi:nucleotide-binding universal stress UspA family protein
MNQLKRILLGTDFSPCSTAALNQAARLARWNNARLRAVHVIDELVVSEYAEALQRPLTQVQQEVIAEAGNRLNRWLAEAGVVDPGVGEVVIGLPLDVLLCRVQGESTSHNDAGNLALKCLRKSRTKVMLVHEAHAGPFRNVVAGVDFSETAREAVEQALRVGQEDQSHVHFVHVFSGPWRRLRFRAETLQAKPDFENQYRALQENRLRSFVGDTRAVKVSFAVVDANSVSYGLAEFARSVDSDLMVLGSKGQSNLRYVLLGSTVERLLREVPCSVLVVRPHNVNAESKHE